MKRRHDSRQTPERKTAFVVGAIGFALMLLGVQFLTSANIVVVVLGWTLVAWGIGAAAFGFSGLYRTRRR
jgi:hypothetical protein